MSKQYGWLSIERSMNIQDAKLLEKDPGINNWFDMPGYNRYTQKEIRALYADMETLKNKYPYSLFRPVSYVKTILA